MLTSIAALLICHQQVAESAEPRNDASCVAGAAARYRVPKELLQAIAKIESGGNYLATHKNKNGTEDIGLMQINSAWLPTLAKYGINRQSLFDPCISTHVAAWVLAGNFARYGYDWRAVDAYNTSKPIRYSIYTRKVARSLQYSPKKGTQIE